MCAFLNDKNIIVFAAVAVLDAVAANLPLSGMRIIRTNYNGNENASEHEILSFMNSIKLN